MVVALSSLVLMVETALLTRLGAERLPAGAGLDLNQPIVNSQLRPLNHDF